MNDAAVMSVKSYNNASRKKYMDLFLKEKTEPQGKNMKKKCD